MNAPQFNNIALQEETIGETIHLFPEGITTAFEKNLVKKHILIISDVRYGYELETDRDHDRDLAMALLLMSLQGDGININSMIDGDEINTSLIDIKEDTDGSIYVTVIDQESDCFDIPVTSLISEDYDNPAASPATKKESIAEATLEAREKYILENRVTDVRLGDYVETSIHKHRGRVTDISEWCDAGNSNAWFRMQTPPYDKAQKMERWITVLVHGGGSVCVAESRVGIVEKFDFSNPYADKYFRDTPSFTATQIDFIKNLAKPLVDDGENLEYTRGICELIADIDGKPDMAQEVRAEEIKAELVN